jgi:uncharacterized membrane protein
MKIVLIIFAIIFIIVKFWSNYLKNDLQANIRFHIKGGSLILGLLVITEYILGAIIIIKIILKIVGE